MPLGCCVLLQRILNVFEFEHQGFALFGFHGATRTTMPCGWVKSGLTQAMVTAPVLLCVGAMTFSTCRLLQLRLRWIFTLGLVACGNAIKQPSKYRGQVNAEPRCWLRSWLFLGCSHPPVKTRYNRRSWDNSAVTSVRVGPPSSTGSNG